MASLIIYPPGAGEAQVVSLDRRVVQIGTSPENDLILPEDSGEPHHAHILYEKGEYTLICPSKAHAALVAGKRRKSHRLSDGEVFELGDCLLRFVLYDQGIQATDETTSQDAGESYFRSLHGFAQKLMATYEVSTLLETLLDELIALTGADKAFLLLIEDGVANVRVARNIDQETLHNAQMAVSDTIVARVLSEGNPLIVADALSHEDFKTSLSVVNLKLCSVMCVPLKARATTLGLFYLGNDNVVNHFSEDLLDVVSVFASTAAQILANALARDELLAQVEDLESQVEVNRFGEIIGACDAMRDIFKKISRVASTDISVLVEGETGTGKELVARALHDRSNRAGKPFVVINCGAIPENLLESEFFGHVRGAFTGAVATQKGKFQAADGGTLFLDEIGEMPLSLQVKILRAIQERTVTKVGDTKAEQVDIRIVAATNRHLQDQVDEGNFREDLFYRLNVITLTLPPLRERGDDLLLIARYLLGRHGQAMDMTPPALSAEAASAIRRWRWPGNIRELENRIKKAIVFSDGGIVTPEDLDLDDDSVAEILPLAEARDRWQSDYINRALTLNDGNRTKTARDLDVDPRTIFRHLERERDGEED
ncbi:MAG: Fis family transcriptional regulator [Deltaproteobacteria bacterium]|nr:Fis family transcriptional regulator [Deltaproteobacteria bacterium]